jgi:EmrB/QacA subfamily drug resistance transporter
MVNNAAVQQPAPVPARAWAALLVGSATVVLIILDAGFVALAFPEIEATFDETSRSTLGWVSSGYFIALSSFMLVAGWLGDRLGRRRVFFVGLLVFAIGALLTALATSAWMLIAARVVQGTGAAALTPVSLAMVLPAFPPERRATAIGAWGVAGAVSGIVAPTSGAFLIEWIGWRAPFILFVPLALIAWLVGRRVLPDESGSDPDGAVDFVGIGAATFAVAAVAVVVVKGDQWGWLDPTTLTFLVVAAVSAPLLVHRARTRVGTPLDVDLFSIRSYASASVVSFLSQAAFFSFFFSAPLFLIDVWEWSTLQAGFAMALNQISAAVVGISAGRWADRNGHSGVIVAGGALGAVGHGWLAWAAGPEVDAWLVMVPSFVIGGVGSMLIGTTTSAAAFRDVDDDRLGRASGSYYVTRRLGSAAGAVAAVAILGDAAGVSAVDRFRLIWGFSAVCFAFAAAVMRFFYPRPSMRATSR